MPYRDLQPFVSTDDLAAFLDATVDPTSLRTKMALDSACDAVRSYLDQDINYVANDVEYHSGHGYQHDRLRLRQRPVVAVVSVYVEGTVVDPLTYNVRDPGVIVLTDGSYFPSGNDNIVVTYNHGWMVPAVSGSASVPADLRLVALSAARRVYSAVGANDVVAVTGETIGDYSYQTGGTSGATTASELLLAEEAVLDRYRIGLVP